MDASPIYAFAVGDSQALFHTSVWLRVSAKRFRCLLQLPQESKKQSRAPGSFLMSGSAESLMISICRPAAGFVFSALAAAVTVAVLSRPRCLHQ